MSNLANALDILRKTREEYPKNPTTSRLIQLIDPSLTGDERFAPDNLCMCLLGHVGVAGGLEPRALTTEAAEDSLPDTFYGPGNVYIPLSDGNGIQTAIFLLAEVIDPSASQGTLNEAQHIVYIFNDVQLEATNAYSRGPKEALTFSDTSVASVLAKIEEAIALGEQKLAEEEKQAKIKSLENAVKILEDAVVEYPKHPTTGELVEYTKTGKYVPWYRRNEVDDLSECACLLGQVALSGGVESSEIRALSYDVLEDGNGIEAAVRFLAMAITGSCPVPGSPERTVYYFNDHTLERITDSSDHRYAFTTASIRKVTDKISDALTLARIELDIAQA